MRLVGVCVRSARNTELRCGLKSQRCRSPCHRHGIGERTRFVDALLHCDGALFYKALTVAPIRTTDVHLITGIYFVHRDRTCHARIQIVLRGDIFVV